MINRLLSIGFLVMAMLGGATTSASALTPPFLPGINFTYFQLQFQFDDYPIDISWTLYSHPADQIIASGGNYPLSLANTSLVLNGMYLYYYGDYTLTVNDAYGDGLCCNFGNGWYEASTTQYLTDPRGRYIDDDFGSQSVWHFTLAGPHINLGDYGGSGLYNYQQFLVATGQSSAVPLPAGLPLMGSALLGLVALRARRARSTNRHPVSV